METQRLPYAYLVQMDVIFVPPKKNVLSVEMVINLTIS